MILCGTATALCGITKTYIMLAAYAAMLFFWHFKLGLKEVRDRAGELAASHVSRTHVTRMPHVYNKLWVASWSVWR